MDEPDQCGACGLRGLRARLRSVLRIASQHLGPGPTPHPRGVRHQSGEDPQRVPPAPQGPHHQVRPHRLPHPPPRRGGPHHSACDGAGEHGGGAQRGAAPGGDRVQAGLAAGHHGGVRAQGRGGHRRELHPAVLAAEEAGGDGGRGVAYRGAGAAGRSQRLPVPPRPAQPGGHPRPEVRRYDLPIAAAEQAVRGGHRGGVLPVQFSAGGLFFRTWPRGTSSPGTARRTGREPRC
mmetsp:Transcript_66986/g.178645  ORF Transcript_66986/g.178645 Transcript_66986/m.178645 type:complete len:234 (-) Transcript_66986:406-1107(-)